MHPWYKWRHTLQPAVSVQPEARVACQAMQMRQHAGPKVHAAACTAFATHKLTAHPRLRPRTLGRLTTLFKCTTKENALAASGSCWKTFWHDYSTFFILSCIGAGFFILSIFACCCFCCARSPGAVQKARGKVRLGWGKPRVATGAPWGAVRGRGGLCVPRSLCGLYAAQRWRQTRYPPAPASPCGPRARHSQLLRTALARLPHPSTRTRASTTRPTPRTPRATRKAAALGPHWSLARRAGPAPQVCCWPTACRPVPGS